MGRNIDAIGYENIMERFRYYVTDDTGGGDLYYSIWGNNKLKWASRETDPDAMIQEFDTMLQAWERSNAGGEMEVRFHPGIADSGTTNKSSYNGSFTYKLHNRHDRIEPYNPGQVSGNPLPAGGSSIQNLVRDIEALEKLKGVLWPGAGAEMGSIPEPPKTIWDRVEQILSTPIVEDVIAGLAGKAGLNMSHYKQDAAIAGDKTQYMNNDVISDAVSHLTELSVDQEERLRDALQRLMVGEKDFVGLMEKLATLKETKPKQYAMAKSFL
jgi:hypothetical protein